MLPEKQGCRGLFLPYRGSQIGKKILATIAIQTIDAEAMTQNPGGNVICLARYTIRNKRAANNKKLSSHMITGKPQ
jgi:hypothetical protein